ncbi:hypothetical protein CCACVL1_27602 [Corchorus capsularis]|uniref:BHLH domain-containing protein n=1 Tax=Corchorus capsularis TaxID=210143 RepID=A0A1R3G9K4_COCAP|nr:hypothetical protein CCACVL1_27602 [Corchorus capsularis]
MDQFIKQLLQGEILWYQTPPPPVSQTAFLPYSNIPRIEFGQQSAAATGCNGGMMMTSGNMNKKMIEFLMKSWSKPNTETRNSERERSFKHMMNERVRREKQKQSYFALHAKLPRGTKNDKNSIVQTATRRVQELEWLKKDLENRNYELQASLGAMNYEEKNDHEGTKITVKIDNPMSGIDSMLEVLKCLKTMDLNPRMIQSKFTTQEFLAVMDIGTQIGAAEVEKVVNITVQEAERKLQERWSR